jgi:two-component system LytT family response regulator
MEIVETTGIEAARNIRSFNTEVIIIFVAASEKYLKEAFELYAYDYMLKPLQHARIRQSINRILHIKKQEDVTSSISTTVKRPKPNPKLLIESNGKSNLVNIREIIFITRYERKIVICYRHGKVSFWNSFEEIKKILTDNFFCSHKGYIINVDYIKEIIPYGKKTYEVTFYGSNETALMTAEKVKLFREKYCLKL